MPFGLKIPAVSLETVMRGIETVFAPPMVALLLITGGWLVVMLRRALAERQLDREARVATLGGWVYLALAAAGYLAPHIYFLFFY